MMTTYFFTAFTQQRLHAARPRPSHHAATWLQWLRQRLLARGQYQRLEELPDYLLDDIGLTRSDIREARRGLFRVH